MKTKKVVALALTIALTVSLAVPAVAVDKKQEIKNEAVSDFCEYMLGLGFFAVSGGPQDFWADLELVLSSSQAMYKLLDALEQLPGGKGEYLAGCYATLDNVIRSIQSTIERFEAFAKMEAVKGTKSLSSAQLKSFQDELVQNIRTCTRLMNEVNYEPILVGDKATKNKINAYAEGVIGFASNFYTSLDSIYEYIYNSTYITTGSFVLTYKSGSATRVLNANCERTTLKNGVVMNGFKTATGDLTQLMSIVSANSKYDNSVYIFIGDSSYALNCSNSKNNTGTSSTQPKKAAPIIVWSNSAKSFNKFDSLFTVKKNGDNTCCTIQHCSSGLYIQMNSSNKAVLATTPTVFTMLAK